MDQTTLSIGDIYTNFTLAPVNSTSPEFKDIQWVLTYQNLWFLALAPMAGIGLKEKRLPNILQQLSKEIHIKSRFLAKMLGQK